MEKVCFNGNWIARDKATIPISNRAFRYGDSLFESFLIHNKTWIFFESHYQRLTEGATILGLVFSSAFRPALLKAISQLPYDISNGRGRLMVYRAGAGKYTPIDNKIEWWLEFTPSSTRGYASHESGMLVDFSEKTILYPSSFSNYKTGNALSYILASKESKERELDDLLLLGPARNVVESTNANIFLRKKNQIYTPPLSQGCLSGVLRKTLISLVEEAPNYELRLEPIDHSDIVKFDEIWLTNASRGIRWVKRFRNSNFANEQYAFWLKKLNDLVEDQSNK